MYLLLRIYNKQCVKLFLISSKLSFLKRKYYVLYGAFFSSGIEYGLPTPPEIINRKDRSMVTIEITDTQFLRREV